jgi:hypothetical protein
MVTNASAADVIAREEGTKVVFLWGYTRLEPDPERMPWGYPL